MSQVVILRRRNGQESKGTAVLVVPQPSVQITKAAVVGVSSVVLAVGSLAIPIAHFLLPWMIPLASGIYVYSTLTDKGRLTEVRGECPACQQSVKLEGGALERPMWRSCPECGDPVDLELATSG